MSIGDAKVVRSADLKSGVITDHLTGEQTKSALPSSNVLSYETERGDHVIIRPSGTEPKIKIYVLTEGESRESAKARADGCLDSFRKMLAD